MRQLRKPILRWVALAAATLVLNVSPSHAVDPDAGVTPAMKALVGQDAPDFSINGLDGSAMKLSNTRGNVVVLDLWALWCPECLVALPHLDKLYKEQSARGLKLFAVNQQDDKDKVKTYVEKKGLSMPVLLDVDAAVAQLYKAESLPETVVIGKDGKIKGIFAGVAQEDAMVALVNKELQ